MGYDSGCRDVGRISNIFKLDQDLVHEIEYVLKNPQYREMYDKSETFVRKKTSKKAPAEG